MPEIGLICHTHVYLEDQSLWRSKNNKKNDCMHVVSEDWWTNRLITIHSYVPNLFFTGQERTQQQKYAFYITKKVMLKKKKYMSYSQSSINHHKQLFQPLFLKQSKQVHFQSKITTWHNIYSLSNQISFLQNTIKY